MTTHIVCALEAPSSFEQAGAFAGELASVLKYVVPIVLGLITMVVYFCAVPLSILAVLFAFINKNYNKRLPARSLLAVSVTCWLWVAVAALLK